MHITRYTDYALRVLVFAACKGEELSTIGEIAQSYDISKNHLMKVVQELNKKGYLHAIRGKNGGLRLKGEAKDISIGALVRDLESDLAIVECMRMTGNEKCIAKPVCQVKGVFAEALDAFLAVLDQYTLEDMLPGARRERMAQILKIVSH